MATHRYEHSAFHRVAIGQGWVQLNGAFRVKQGALEFAVHEQLFTGKCVGEGIIGLEFYRSVSVNSH